MVQATRNVLLVAVICVMWAGSVAAQETANRWPRVVIEDIVTRAAIYSALDRAQEWFAHTQCQSVMTEFRDEADCPLAGKLAGLGTTFDGYLQWVLIRDGSHSKSCDSPTTFAVTTPGNRVVYVCTRAFENLALKDPARASAVVIHEVLHTLGLGEDGRHPTSNAITWRILARCAN
jgi:hypothetical protein